MTAQNRAALKALFETGDTMLQTSFQNLIDSFASLTDTAAQTIASPVTFNTSVICSDTIELTGGVSGTLAFTGSLRGQVTSIAALGTTKASAAPVSAFIAILNTVSAGTNDGIRLETIATGACQYIINNTSATAMVYPALSQLFGTIDGTAAVKLMPNQRMTIVGENLTAAYSIIGARASV